MIISRGRSYIFVHIPKTGGTSMALALEERAMADDILIGDTPKAKKRRRRIEGVQSRGRLWKHSMLSDIEGLVKPEEVRQMFCFTLVRNPWDRLVSYYFWLGKQKFQHPAIKAAKMLQFGAFLRAPEVVEPLRVSPASRYMSASDGRAYDALYIRLEHFEEDAAPLFEHLGFEIELPQVNRSERQKDYRSYYRADDAEVVAGLCAEDIRRFGYDFDEG